MRTWVIFIICVFPAIALSAGKSDEAEPTQLELTAADQIIKDIRDSHPPENGSFFFRTGLMQIDVNTKDAVNLNDEGVLPFVGGEFQWDIIDKLGIEIRGYYAQNSLYTSSTPEKNGTGAYQYTYDFGLRYTFVLDATETLNFFGFKIMSHTLKNNFKVFNPTDLDDDSQPYIHMSDYQALIVGIERSFQITPAISLLASLDFLSIQNTKSDTSQEFEKSGLGFQVRGEVFYRMDLLGVPGRMGLMYWQGAYTNEVKNVDDASSENENLGRSTHVQSFRNITLGYSIWY